MVYIIVKEYSHYNKALPNWHSPKGRYISSKKQYYDEVRQAGLIPYEQAEEIRRDNEEIAKKNRGYSKDTIQFLESVSSKADKKGKVRLSDKEVKFMIDNGAIKDRDKFSKYLPSHYQESGGFS